MALPGLGDALGKGGIHGKATGHELLGTQPGEGEARLLIRKGEPVRNDRTMTVIMSTASLEVAVYPRDKALADAVLGMDVNVVFEGAGVRMPQRGYRSRLSGLVGGVFTSKVERVMNREIGWPLPQESILILQDLGGALLPVRPLYVRVRGPRAGPHHR
jgi:hypothetical protein